MSGFHKYECIPETHLCVMQTSKNSFSEQSNDIEQTSTQIPSSQTITLLDDDEEEDDEMPLAKLSRFSKKQEGKGKKPQSQQKDQPTQNNVGSSSLSSRAKSARRLAKSIKQE